MAEGGEFGYDNTEPRRKLESDGPDIEDLSEFDDDDDKQEINTTGRFQPGTASTFYHGDVEIEIKKATREGLPA